jgi:hypothetical protein
MSAHGGGIGGDGMAQLRARTRARVRVQRAVAVVSRRGVRGQRAWAWAWARRGRAKVGCHDAHEAHAVGHAVVVLRRVRCVNANAVLCVRWALGAVGMGGV